MDNPKYPPISVITAPTYLLFRYGVLLTIIAGMCAVGFVLGAVCAVTLYQNQLKSQDNQMKIIHMIETMGESK